MNFIADSLLITVNIVRISATWPEIPILNENNKNIIGYLDNFLITFTGT
jgi:hypothetical protein